MPIPPPPNLPAVTFTTNATGAGSTEVNVKLCAYVFYGPTDSSTWWAVGNATEILASIAISGPGNEGKSGVVSVALLVAGLTPSTVYTFYWLVQSNDALFQIDQTDEDGGGASYATVPTVLGGNAIMEVWAA